MLDTLRRLETPEGIGLNLRIAGPVVRGLAWVIDMLIRYGVLWVLLIVMSQLGGGGFGIWLIVLFLAEWLYPVLFEVYGGGATPGKRALGIKVTQANGMPVDWLAALIRNLLRAVDFLPVFYGFGLVAMFTNRDFQRLGDLAAGTLVIYRDTAARQVALPSGTALPPPCPLTPSEQQLLIDYAERGTTLNVERQAELAAILAPLTKLHGIAGVERLRAYARWLVGER